MLQIDYAMSKQHFFMRHFNFCNYTKAIIIQISHAWLRPPGYGPVNISDPVVRPENFIQRRSSSLKSFYPT